MTGDDIQARGMALTKIFMPYAAERLRIVQERKGRFVHYTSAENALNIIKSKSIWMRNTKCMNDYTEVVQGYNHLHQFFNQQNHSEAFRGAMDHVVPGVAQEALTQFDQWWGELQLNTFITSISEHDDREDAHGRLSMWRAYGQTSSRAALVLRLPEDGAASGLNVFVSPVAYFEYPEVELQIYSVIKNIQDNADLLKSMDRELVKNAIFYMLVAAAVSLKHVGFAEEREWRIIYTPRLRPSKFLQHSIESVGGVPQVVHKIVFEDHPTEQVSNIEIPKLIDRVIVGPTVYFTPMYQAFVEALQNAGVTDAEKRVTASNIPLRT